MWSSRCLPWHAILFSWHCSFFDLANTIALSEQQVQEKSPSPEASPLNRSGSARKVNTASSRLLAPTASYLTRVTSARKESKAAREAAEAAERERKAKELKKVMESPQVCAHAHRNEAQTSICTLPDLQSAHACLSLHVGLQPCAFKG